jgi:hypothetical protein
MPRNKKIWYWKNKHVILQNIIRPGVYYFQSEKLLKSKQYHNTLADHQLYNIICTHNYLSMGKEERERVFTCFSVNLGMLIYKCHYFPYATYFFYCFDNMRPEYVKLFLSVSPTTTFFNNPGEIIWAASLSKRKTARFSVVLTIPLSL